MKQLNANAEGEIPNKVLGISPFFLFYKLNEIDFHVCALMSLFRVMLNSRTDFQIMKVKNTMNRYEQIKEKLEQLALIHPKKIREICELVRLMKDEYDDHILQNNFNHNCENCVLARPDDDFDD